MIDLHNQIPYSECLKTKPNPDTNSASCITHTVKPKNLTLYRIRASMQVSRHMLQRPTVSVRVVGLDYTISPAIKTQFN